MIRKTNNLRSLNWNVFSEPNPTIHHWTFLIVNAPREIEIVRQKIREALASTDAETIVTKGKVPNSDGLEYMALRVDSYKTGQIEDIDIREVYSGKEFRRNRFLGTHRTPDGLANYVNKMFS